MPVSSWSTVKSQLGLVIILFLYPDASFADPRKNHVFSVCGSQKNNTITDLSYYNTIESIRSQMEYSVFGIQLAGKDMNYGLAQCYGDLSLGDCTQCYDFIASGSYACIPVAEVRMFYDGCFLRVGNYNFFEEISSPNDTAVCGRRNSTQKVDSMFQESTRQAISQVLDAAPKSGYASSKVMVGTTGTSVYVLANCWKTINATSCRLCLENANASLSTCFNQSEGRAMNTGCFIRYSDLNFLNEIPKGINKILVACIIAAATTLLIVSAALGVHLWKRKLKNGGTTVTSRMAIELFLKKNENLAPKRFKYANLKKITNSFSETLGKGGFGSVYKGELHDGHLVAVKILNHDRKGDGEEFMNEVLSISRTSHVNIVTLLGFCFEGSKRALIYEYMPNGSLEKFLCKTSSTQDGQLGWEKLFEIAVGIARGLEYLHQGCKTRILHLDIKPHNILLDKNMKPKISDFGLAICPNRASIIPMLGIKGTRGYIAPEIINRNFGEVSDKSDVYSYGMLVLDMVGGRKNVNAGVESGSDIYFPDWIYKELARNESSNCMDDQVHDEWEFAKRKLTITGLWCIQTEPKLRPCISRVIEMLEGNLESLQIPPKPYLFSPPRVEADTSISTFESSE